MKLKSSQTGKTLAEVGWDTRRWQRRMANHHTERGKIVVFYPCCHRRREEGTPKYSYHHDDVGSRVAIARLRSKSDCRIGRST